VLADLRELDRLTGGPGGARRVAWTPEWLAARNWLRGRLAEINCTAETDDAGNLYATIPGERDEFVLAGSHIDSVPGGGRLDGALGVLAALEVLRRWAAERPPVSLRLVDWADEEGARFGMSLFGSSAATGALDLDAAAGLHDGSVSLAEAMDNCGFDLRRAPAAQRSLEGALAYVELHIEQGPVLERRGKRTAVVTGTTGVERHRLLLEGEAAHAGAAPMDMRRDPVVAAARIVDAVTSAAIEQGGTATVGKIEVSPGVGTIVADSCRLTVDLRAPDATVLDRRLAEAKSAAGTIGATAGVDMTWELQWRIAPRPFDPVLIGLAREACEACGEEPLELTSGALHDAAALGAVVPAVMLFVPSRRGISHSAAEDTGEADLVAGIRAFDALVERALRHFAATA
jgi:N-carbamoyl-L-amino-acid hydrolase